MHTMYNLLICMKLESISSHIEMWTLMEHEGWLVKKKHDLKRENDLGMMMEALKWGISMKDDLITTLQWNGAFAGVAISLFFFIFSNLLSMLLFYGLTLLELMLTILDPFVDHACGGGATFFPNCASHFLTRKAFRLSIYNYLIYYTSEGLAW